MDVEVKGIDDLKKALKEIEEFGDTTIMNAVGQDVVKLMVDRTTSGKDTDHNTFDGYSTFYKKKSGKGDPPDLKLSGNMLNAVKARVIDPLTVVVRVTGGDAYNVGMMHQAGKKGMPVRKWFGLDHTEDREKISERFKKLLLAKIIKTWNK